MANPTKSVTEAVAELRARSGLTRKALATLMGFAGGSSIQHYEDPTRFRKKYLPLDIAERFANAFSGLGSPPITYEEVMALAGHEVDREKPTQQDRQAHAEFALNGSDQYMARVLEDVIKLLIEKKVFLQADLPKPASDLLDRRRQLRAAHNGGDDD